MWQTYTVSQPEHVQTSYKMASEKVTVVLKTADDWDEWVEIIKSAAIDLSDVKEGATGINGLNEDKFLKSLKEYELIICISVRGSEKSTNESAPQTPCESR